MKSAKTIIWIIAAVGAILLGIVLFRPAGGSVENVDDARMQELIGEGVRVIDVRTAGEYQMGHIPGAENVPISGFEAVAGSWDPAQPVAVYCATGSRSISAVQYLSDHGFTKVYHFNAGIIAYSGELQTGETISQVPDSETLDTPVLYEFYTDW